jgi:hypothetical protein
MRTEKHTRDRRPSLNRQSLPAGHRKVAESAEKAGFLPPVPRIVAPGLV